MINMKKSDALYLSAREAAAELAISPATLYAYVSRGLIRSEPPPDPRSHTHPAGGVRGLTGLVAAISTITENGPIYRGVNCVELADKDTLEHTATLLWDVTAVDPF